MKISELIKELEAAKKYVGDIEVVYTQDTYNIYFNLHSDDIKVVEASKITENSDRIFLSLTGDLHIREMENFFESIRKE